MYELEQEQTFPIAGEQLWEFISLPENLNAITPPELDFEIRSEVPERMYNGLIIRYRIKIPGFGSRDWITEIKHIREGISFVDEQRFGPYRFWFHYHEMSPVAGGVRMLDRVSYKVPFGVLGRMVHRLFIQKMLRTIFDYRFQKLEERFGSWNAE